MFQDVFDPGSLLLHPSRSDGTTQKINFRCTKETFIHCKLQASLLNALKCGSDLVDELFGIIGSYTNIINILRTLVCFNDFVQIFAHEAKKKR